MSSCNALVTGTITSSETRIDANGRPYALVRLLTGHAPSERSQRNRVSVVVVAWHRPAIDQLAALEEGDEVAVSGHCQPQAAIEEDGTLRTWLRVAAHGVLSPYKARRKRIMASGNTLEIDEMLEAEQASEGLPAGERGPHECAPDAR